MVLAFVGTQMPKATLLIGFIQFLLSDRWFYIGYIWSIAWGVLQFINKNPNASSAEQAVPNPYEIPNRK